MTEQAFTKSPLRILHLEDDKHDAELVRECLTEDGISFELEVVETGEDFLAALDTGEFDLVIGDSSLPSFDGMTALAAVRAKYKYLPFILVSGTIGEHVAVEALKNGATDYIMKSRMYRLGAAVRRALQEVEERVERDRVQKALQESEERFRTMAENIQEVFWMTSADFNRVFHVSPAYEKLWGRVAEGDYEDPNSWFEAILKEDRDQVREALRGLSMGKEYITEYRIRRPDGSIRWVEDRGYPVYDKSNTLDRYVGVAADITDRKQAKLALMEQIHLAAFSADVGIALTQDESLPKILNLCTDAVVKHLDAAFARIWTLNAEQKVLEVQATSGFMSLEHRIDGPVPVGKSIIGKIAEDRRPHISDAVLRNLDIGDSSAAKGEEIVSFAGYPLLFGNQLVGVLAVLAHGPVKSTIHNAMESVANHIALGIHRHWTQDALRKSEQQYRRLFEDSKDVVFISSLDGQFLDINRAGIELFGYSSKEEMLQLEIASDIYWSPQEREAWIQQLLSQGYVQDYEKVLKRKDGQKLITVETSTAVRNDDGKIVAYRGIMRDVTNLKSLQERLVRSQKMEAIGQLAGGVAHDFNNILMAVGSYAELLLMKMSENDPHRKEILEMEKVIGQGANLTRQLLAFGRRQVLTPRILDLRNAVSSLEKMIQRFIGENIEMESYFSEDLGQVEADPGQIEQVLINMALNARDAMPGGGKLTIEIQNVELDEAYVKQHPDVKPGRYVMLAISDTGCGMSDETTARIFEPFFTTKEEGKGTGLGLASVYGIVKQSGGHVFVYSQLDRGTTFKVYFPRVRSNKDEETTPFSASLAAGGNETILLVDDNESVRTAIAAFLELTGYTVLQADHGRKAIELAGQHPKPIHLLITDVIMPGMNGWELAERLKAKLPDLKILHMSGFSEEAVRRKALLGPDAAFLSKPATMESLLRKIREMLG